MFSRLRSSLAALRGWLRDLGEARIQTGIAIVALIVAVIALEPVVSDLRASPEERLAKLGYKKTYEEFWRAISNKHLEAAELFGEAKVRLAPGDFHRLFDGRVFDPEIFAALRKRGAIDNRDCPTDIEGVRLYPAVARNPEMAQRLRDLCANPAVVAQIAAARAAEADRLAQAARRAEKQPGWLKRCEAGYASENPGRLLDEAATFDALAPRTYSERQCVLAEVKTGLIVQGATGAGAAELIARSAARCCARYGQSPAPDSSRLRSADDALAMLKDG
ncbi:MAG TPA: hypothetical protein VES00_22625 [Burkholderiaceae bacterium]|nr:hypothetical protein [Burkholderiaceae bacterium]